FTQCQITSISICTIPRLKRSGVTVGNYRSHESWINKKKTAPIVAQKAKFFRAIRIIAIPLLFIVKFYNCLVSNFYLLLYLIKIAINLNFTNKLATALK